MVTGRCPVTTVTAEGHDPSMGVFMVRRPARLAALAAVALLAPMVATLGASPGAAATGDDTAILTIPKGEVADEFSEIEETTDFAKLRDAYFETRLLSGDRPLTIEKAAKLRGKGITAASQLPTVGGTASRASEARGPASARTRSSRSVRTTNTFDAMSGRIGALAIRNNGTIILGAAQGGVWTYDAATGTWTLAHARTPTPRRSAPWRWRRATTASSTWARARARSPVTATTATASTGPPTAA